MWANIANLFPFRIRVRPSEDIVGAMKAVSKTCMPKSTTLCFLFEQAWYARWRVPAVLLVISVLFDFRLQLHINL